MNGAELPCGTVIGVQPADMDYKKKAQQQEVKKDPQQSETSLSQSELTLMSANATNTRNISFDSYLGHENHVRHSVSSSLKEATNSNEKQSTNSELNEMHKTETTLMPAAEEVTNEVIKESKETTAHGDHDDLDDFFASLVHE